MKRFLSLTSRALLLCVLLAGCNPLYQDTPKDAYLVEPFYDRSEDVTFDTIQYEIDCISLSDSETVWFAVVNNDCILEAFMDVENGKYRVEHRGVTRGYFILDSDIDASSTDELLYNSYDLLDSGKTVYWTFILSESLPAKGAEHDYTIKHYTVPVNGEDTDLTLVYYFEEMS